jgi:hypothetical protein
VTISMRPTGLRRSARLCMGALIALLAWGLFAPAKVRAECSHPYIVTHAADSTGPAHFVFLNRTEGSQPDSGMPDQPTPRCSGPACSRAPLLPQAPQPIPTVSQVEHWACLPLSIVFDGPNLIVFASDQSLLAISHVGQTIFHPPRASR